MKLASLKGGRDGRLVLVSRDLTRAVDAKAVAPTLQAALDNWHHVEPQLRSLARLLEDGQMREAFAFDPAKAAAPLPRAYQWADGSAYVNHVELVRKARGAEMPPSFWTDPLMYQGGADAMLGPTDDIEMADEAWGIDFESEVAIVTDDVRMGISPQGAARHIKLVMLVNDVSLRNLIPNELAKGFGFVNGKGANALAPVAITPDELGPAWKDGRIHLELTCDVNGSRLGHPNAGRDATFGLFDLIAHAARTRELAAGTVIGTGTISNQDMSVGYACLMEKRLVEQVEQGEAKTPFLRFGDRVRIEMKDSGESVFGAIDQVVERYT